MFGDLLSLFLALFVFSAFNVLWISLLIHILLFFTPLQSERLK